MYFVAIILLFIIKLDMLRCTFLWQFHFTFRTDVCSLLYYHVYIVCFKYFGYFQPLSFKRYIISIGIHDTSFESLGVELSSPGTKIVISRKSKPKLKPLENGEIQRRTEEVHCQGLRKKPFVLNCSPRIHQAL